MSIRVGYNPDFATGSSAKKRLTESKPDPNIRQNIARVLFGKNIPSTSAISFGWSEYLSKTETDILDTLTDPANKIAILASHSYPDGDAYGSNIGIAGILESLGKKVYSVIDYRPKLTFQYLPSPQPNVSAINYIKGIESINRLKKSDIAVITDVGEPILLNETKKASGNKVLETILKTHPKKVILIDHHPDQPGEPTNEQKWLNELAKNGYSPKNVLYWREKRASASEMISELDQELVYESQKRKINNYNPKFNHNYRLSVATGIITDAGGRFPEGGHIDETRFQRLSYTKSPGSNISTTRADFEWLINTCGIKKDDIDTAKLISKIPIDPELVEKIDRVINKTDTLKDVEVKLPSKGDPLGYVYIKSWDGLEGLARNAKEVEGFKANAKIVYKIIKAKMIDKLVEDNNAGLFVLANRSGKNTFLTLRSYGYDYAVGELHKPGHVFGDALAMKVNKKLDPLHGSGGGHKNAVGFKSDNNVDFHTQLLPFIKEAVEEYIGDKDDLTKIPKNKLEQLKSLAFVNTLETY